WSTYNVVLVISNYYEYPVSTITTVKFKVKQHHECRPQDAGNLDFPAVSVCNLNQLAEFDGWNTGEKGILRQMSEIRTVLDFMSLQKRYESGHQLQEMLIGCIYQGEQCTSKQFQRFYNFHVGTCFTFNKKNNQAPVSKPGPLHGLSLVLDAQSEEYMNHSQTVGFKVVVHPQNDMPFPEDEGILVSPGTVTDVAVTQEVVLRAPPPHGNCSTYIGHENLLRNMYAEEFNVGYTAQACHRTCYQKLTIRKCNCCDSDYPCPAYMFGDVNLTFCEFHPDNESNPYELMEKLNKAGCMDEVREAIKAGHVECEGLCKESCTETVFWEETSAGMWPSEAYVHTLIETHPNLSYKDIDTIRKNIVKVRVYFKQLNYQKVETVPAYNWYRLLSDIGGQLGLWVGFSVLTMVEILQLLLDLGRHLLLRTTLAGHQKLSTSFRKRDGVTPPV
ncbi:hypothetical protein BaRGS_00017416, partial [Batillaria attramentaria]